MTKWKEKARLNLLRLSQENSDYLLSAKEWEFNGNIIDHGNANNKCELCEGENLRHHFQIDNKKNNAQIWVGSSCIHKFDILVRADDGTVIHDTEDRRKYLNKKLSDKKRELLINSLRSLWKEVNDYEKDVIRKVGECCKAKEAVNPTLVIDLLKIIYSYKPDIDISVIKVSLNSNYYIDLTARQTDDDRKLLYKIINQKQIEKIENRVKQIDCEEERNKKYDELIEAQARRRAKERLVSQKNYFAENERKNIFIMPEFITCSICGKYTKDWVSMNPDICRECIRNQLCND